MKNSTSLVEGERDLEDAKKQSAKESRKEEKLKKKEDGALKKALAISELEAKRQEEVNHLNNVQTVTSKESTQLHLLGTVASHTTCTNPFNLPCITCVSRKRGV